MATAAPPADCTISRRPAGAEAYLIICGIGKVNNVDALCFAAAAHGLRPVIVGLHSLIAEDHFTDIQPPFDILRFATLSELRLFLREIPLIGIEILDSAVPFMEYSLPPDGRIALMPGNEGTGLNKPQIEACQGFIYVPQLGAGTASLNVHVATSLILHRYFPQSTS